jgi:hypothetical protein
MTSPVVAAAENREKNQRQSEKSKNTVVTGTTVVVF